MTNRYRDAKHALWSVSEEIYRYAYDFYSLPSEWDGHDVFITSDPAAAGDNPGTGRLVMVTSAAPQISWLFGRLRDAFSNLGGLESRHYVRLIGVARAHELTSDAEYKVNGILRAVMDEAFLILEEIQTGEVQAPTPMAETDLSALPNPRGKHGLQEAVFG